ncbi:MAG: imidazole glycerol phosphate synthase, glutamine amidotransferase subunit [Candidatus Wildermuthbacteria bacterium RIFCSPHIGHO2_02_FULL_45_25]|uniref:Imidazole glycerol phosphate synthase subunit HisH n=1 Tax=Candidatus Wildermuthbacteria bacterium RIFCSPHIGHO2_02_FULL_45_25 TaxID=1802450 RepID=A0A1G2R473_9BACT|nr:MAG: imidazole glycerol phosphate synthase, glutamine amidotransferase subunit [Candidatus Wildermuthbacteria bacterium RIFCSPHIGHO2_02_FULL_45_25]
MSKVAIINYGMGNLDSVARAIQECGGNIEITSSADNVKSATHIILPGVGSFRKGMENLKSLQLMDVLKEQIIVKKIPFLGICLGMQLLATKGQEGGETEGLGLLEGEVKMLECVSEERLPHMGWNEVDYEKESSLFFSIPSHRDFYFCHSYHFVPADDSHVIARTSYCQNFVSAVQKRNLFGVQFHPEKSQAMGFQILKNFLAFSHA